MSRQSDLSNAFYELKENSENKLFNTIPSNQNNVQPNLYYLDSIT